jgi:cyclophilin family peptidyl-prolyl cis-trans isomerase
MIRCFALLLTLFCIFNSRAGTMASFNTSVGNMEMELYDDDKPITVDNFIKYVITGRFKDIFIQRWETNFVIQAGGYYVTNTSAGSKILPVTTFPEIKNEYSVGRQFSNTYGTIAMARRGGDTNSASSQWFFNLKDNSFLDDVDGGFTVFGKVTAGTNVLNLFIPPPTNNGIYKVSAPPLTTLPVLSPAPTVDDLIYVHIKLWRDLGLKFAIIRGGARQIQWTSALNHPNILETSTQGGTAWQTVTNFVGNGAPVIVFDRAPKAQNQIYRVRIDYP